jgi:hypothetical protein
VVVVRDFPLLQRQGVITTPSFTIPINMPNGEIQVVGDIPTGDYENPANRIFADLYQSDLSLPGGWRLRASNRPSGWLGGPFVNEDGVVNPAPVFFSLSVSDFERGKTFRAEFDVPVRMRVGLTVQRLEFP